jgi:hypothetical protein
MSAVLGDTEIYLTAKPRRRFGVRFLAGSLHQSYPYMHVSMFINTS